MACYCNKLRLLVCYLGTSWSSVVTLDLAAELGQVGIEAEVDSAQLIALIIGIEHLLAAGQDESVCVEADGDAVARDVSQSSDVALEGGEEGLFVWSVGVFSLHLWGAQPTRMKSRARVPTRQSEQNRITNSANRRIS